MKKDSLKKKIGILALTGIVASFTILPCVVKASEILEEPKEKSQKVWSFLYWYNAKYRSSIAKSRCKNDACQY